MISFPNAKINLGLNVTGTRPDGFHDIETVMIPVGFSDILEIVPSASQQTEFRQTGIPIPGSESDNLCLRAWELVRPGIHNGIRMHLHKVIPVGSGLGGGSSDAVSALKLLNALFVPGMDELQMMDIAGKLGSDCAFFIRNQPVFATARGDHLSPIELNLEGLFIIIVVPPIQVNTADAYQFVVNKKPVERIPEILRASPGEWKDRLVNDFEESVFARYPAIGKIKEELYTSGALYASMSGSGSAVFGLFERAVPQVTFEGCTVWRGKLS